MNIERIKKLLAEREHLRLEFKEAVSALPGNLFETICAMLNRDGGDILLGVSDSGEVIGVDPESSGTLIANLVNLSNNPHGEGPIDPVNFTPFPKNPTIAKFFMQLGRVDELGSGVLNVTQFIKEYSDRSTPEFIEGPVFKMNIPLPQAKSEILDEGLDEGLNKGLNEGLKSLIAAIASNPGIQAKALSILLNYRPIKTLERQIQNLNELGLIERRGSRKTGGYYCKAKQEDIV
jgi:predicted HTH transcriptional regulator